MLKSIPQECRTAEALTAKSHSERLSRQLDDRGQSFLRFDLGVGSDALQSRKIRESSAPAFEGASQCTGAPMVKHFREGRCSEEFSGLFCKPRPGISIRLIGPLSRDWI